VKKNAKVKFVFPQELIDLIDADRYADGTGISRAQWVRIACARMLDRNKE
jgi:hypothetical protein